MPVEFLSDEQVKAYAAFEEVPSQSDLERFFFLDARDLDLIALRRFDHHKLGLALQIGTVRCKGLFLEDPLDVPWPVVEYLAEQLLIADASCVKRYSERRQTLYDHQWEITKKYTFHDFEDPVWGTIWLHGAPCYGGAGDRRDPTALHPLAAWVAVHETPPDQSVKTTSGICAEDYGNRHLCVRDAPQCKQNRDSVSVPASRTLILFVGV